MGRNKKKGRGGGPGISKKMAEGSRGERLRKREEERAIKRANKRRKLGKKPLEVDKSGGHEGRVKKHANKRRLELARLERLVLKQEELLRDYRPPVHVAPLDPELKRKRRRRDFYDLDTSHWQLKGAARPAASLPGAGGTELVNERDDWQPGEDLFEKLGGISVDGAGGGDSDTDGDDSSDDGSGCGDEEGDEKDGARAAGGAGKKEKRQGGEEEKKGKRSGGGGFYEGPEACREYLDLNHQLAQRLHEGGKESQTEEALKRYQRSLELDPIDHIKARRGLVRLLLDAGDAEKARGVIDRFPDDRGCEMAWSLAAIEFVAWSVLQEDGSGEEVAEKALAEACRANPFVAWNIAHREIFDQVVEHADEIESPPGGSVMEALWYMVREGGLWESLEGSSDWVADFLLRKEMLPPNPHEGAIPSDGPQPPSAGDRKPTGNNKRGRPGDDAVQGGSAPRKAAASSAEDDGNAGMFANMFETAVGMAAEMAEQQLGMEEEEGGDSGGEEEEAADDGKGAGGGGRDGSEGDGVGSSSSSDEADGF